MPMTCLGPILHVSTVVLWEGQEAWPSVRCLAHHWPRNEISIESYYASGINIYEWLYVGFFYVKNCIFWTYNIWLTKSFWWPAPYLRLLPPNVETIEPGDSLSHIGRQESQIGRRSPERFCRSYIICSTMQFFRYRPWRLYNGSITTETQQRRRIMFAVVRQSSVIDWLKIFIPLDTKWVISETFSPANLLIDLAIKMFIVSLLSHRVVTNCSILQIRRKQKFCHQNGLRARLHVRPVWRQL